MGLFSFLTILIVLALLAFHGTLVYHFTKRRELGNRSIFPGKKSYRNEFGFTSVKSTSSKQYKVAVLYSFISIFILGYVLIVLFLGRSFSDVSLLLVGAVIPYYILYPNIFDVREDGFVMQGIIIKWDNIKSYDWQGDLEDEDKPVRFRLTTKTRPFFLFKRYASPLIPLEGKGIIDYMLKNKDITG